MSKLRRTLCPTPEAHCTGQETKMAKNYRGSKKTHVDGKEARNCYKRYLKSIGYKQGEKANEMIPPDPTQPVLVLTRERHFGGKPMRKGKSDWMMNEKGAGHVVG